MRNEDECLYVCEVEAGEEDKEEVMTCLNCACLKRENKASYSFFIQHSIQYCSSEGTQIRRMKKLRFNFQRRLNS
jgi:hypothetical protein